MTQEITVLGLEDLSFVLFLYCCKCINFSEDSSDSHWCNKADISVQESSHAEGAYSIFKCLNNPG